MPSTVGPSTDTSQTQRPRLAQARRERVVFRVFAGRGGIWNVENEGGDAGGLFVSRAAALRYADDEAAACGAAINVENEIHAAGAANG